MCDDKKTKKYIAMLKTMIAYDEMNDYLDDFIKNHQDDNLIEQIRLLQQDMPAVQESVFVSSCVPSPENR